MDISMILLLTTLFTSSATIVLAVLLRYERQRLLGAEERACTLQEQLDGEQHRHLEERRELQDRISGLQAEGERRHRAGVEEGRKTMAAELQPRLAALERQLAEEQRLRLEQRRELQDRISKLQAEGERRHRAGVEEGRRAMAAELQPRLAALERQLAEEQRLRLEQRRELQDRISKLQAEGERRYHAGIEEGMRRERENYTILVTPFVRRHEGWFSSSCTYGYRLRFQVRGLPTAWEYEQVLARKEKVADSQAAQLATQAARAAVTCAVAKFVPALITAA